MTHYTPLQHSGNDEYGHIKPIHKFGYRIDTSRLKTTCAIVCTFVVAVLLGFMWGKSSSQPSFAIPVSVVTQNFQYDRNFSYAPSNITNAAWKSIFPQDGGFFSHPSLGSERVTLAVFHQLHCLDAIRQSYWQLHEAAFEGRKLLDDDLPMHMSPSHVRHCTDLLRQSLMCAGDRTIEHKVDKGGVSGFGTTHQCCNYKELVHIVESWQS